MSTIKNRVLKTEMVNWIDLEAFQPKGVKKATEVNLDKLRNSLKKNGFATPFYIWNNNGINLSLDGHHRKMVLIELVEAGIEVPELLPGVFLDVKNEEEAKKIWLVIGSHYATFDKKPTMDFLDGFNFDELANEIKLFSLGFNFDIKESDNEREIEELETDCKCPKCGYEFDYSAERTKKKDRDYKEMARFGFIASEYLVGKCCEKCGVSNEEHIEKFGERLSINHRNNQGRSAMKKGLKPDNRQENLQILCRSCHTVFSNENEQDYTGRGDKIRETIKNKKAKDTLDAIS